MPQIFHRSTNTFSRFSIVVALLSVTAFFFAAAEMQSAPYLSWRGVIRTQPVPFSHKHHAGGLGIDCRYCHTSVEVSGYAGLPPTKTCMNCHSQIWTNAALLEPVRESFRSGNSINWTKVNYIPDFVYFDHSIHINKGVGCNSCHGPVDQMALMYQDSTMQMEWCLSCHRGPEKFLRPRGEQFNMRYQQPTPSNPVKYDGQTFTEQLQLGSYLAKKYHVRTPPEITSCSTCHR
ncbi:MAG TPA: cytochrome c3 family protein [Terriglobales bacterium]|nr:cytochrome c3 family protein [Terriglobales bacterium]